MRLFPQQYADVHEIQGGEQKTHELFVAFGRDTVTDEPLAWCRQRAARARHAGVVRRIRRGALPDARRPCRSARSIVGWWTRPSRAPTPSSTSARSIDEYGWRHFGDIYGDHEGVRHTGPTPLVSHYNNQYDVVGGFGDASSSAAATSAGGR